jgi:hypothetical protein
MTASLPRGQQGSAIETVPGDGKDTVVIDLANHATKGQHAVQPHDHHGDRRTANKSGEEGQLTARPDCFAGPNNPG